MRTLTLISGAAILALLGQPLAAQQSPSDVTAEELLKVPVTKLRVAGTPKPPTIDNPYEGSDKAVKEGEALFDAMNCSGCHAPMGAGGMGPPLSDDVWVYGGTPADIFLSLQQGRPNGMPSWGHIGEESIWKLVTYVRSLNERAEEFAQAR